jgi:AraC-like DNA-binding protein
MAMRLVARPPRPPLAPFVSTVWLADQYVPGPHTAMVSGPRSRSFVLDTAAQFSVAGAEFTAGGAPAFFDLPMREIANRHLALDAAWGPLAAQMRECKLHAPTAERRLDVLERILRARLARGRTRHGAVGYAVREFLSRPSVVRIGDVTGRIGLSHRRFLDLFTAEVGLTPKVFCRVQRFQRVVQQVHRLREIDWARVAVDAGYYDQAHFIRDFQAFSGVNPTTYASHRGPHHNHVPLA